MGVTWPQAALLVVTLYPSNTPDWAAIPAPVQMVMRYLSFGKALLINSTSGCRSLDLAPGPPGTIRTSISCGGWANV